MRNTSPYFVGISLIVSGLFAVGCGGDVEGVEGDGDGDTTEVRTQDLFVACDLAPVFWTRYQFNLESASGAALTTFEGTLGFRHADLAYRTTLECPPSADGASSHSCVRTEAGGAPWVDGTGTVNYLSQGGEGALVELEVVAKNGERFAGEVEAVDGVVPSEGSVMDCHNLARVVDLTIRLEAAP